MAISTVRSQLRSNFTKTGTTRQSELMNLMNRCLMLPAGR
ncbi:DNA-binding CsgD family transcriptional regulator [Azospirillum picis]|uniref:DNA-binding CsgD family transcriptional regulator n=1 Tax=Azospirillum picis TaxID=488438 RepID=A0ABU0MRZ7_9PROT|nr:DNA-binding CsgD family transcriptional regulator [Azospirillum picis]MDQ0536089.1 DNA-binding CsgD family transcriptional regulator [Azospirillum picis]